MIDLLICVLIGLFIFLSVKTIKMQNGRIVKLEAFVSDYMEGKSEPVHQRHTKDDEPLNSAY